MRHVAAWENYRLIQSDKGWRCPSLSLCVRGIQHSGGQIARLYSHTSRWVCWWCSSLAAYETRHRHPWWRSALKSRHFPELFWRGCVSERKCPWAHVRIRKENLQKIRRERVDPPTLNALENVPAVANTSDSDNLLLRSLYAYCTFSKFSRVHFWQQWLIHVNERDSKSSDTIQI